MHDEYPEYKSLYGEDFARLAVANSFVRDNTINSIIGRLEWLRDRFAAAHLPTTNFNACIELIRSMKND